MPSRPVFARWASPGSFRHDRLVEPKQVNMRLLIEPAVALRAMAWQPSLREGLAEPKQAQPAKAGGARRDRTADRVIANDALSQLSYGPVATGMLRKPVDNRRHLPSGPRSSQER